MALPQIRYAALHAAEQVSHQFDRTTLFFGISFAQELLQGQADDLRPPAPRVSRNLVEFSGQIGRHSKSQLPLHVRLLFSRNSMYCIAMQLVNEPGFLGRELGPSVAGQRPWYRWISIREQEGIQATDKKVTFPWITIYRLLMARWRKTGLCLINTASCNRSGPRRLWDRRGPDYWNGKGIGEICGDA